MAVARSDAWTDYARDDDGQGYRDALPRCLQRLPARERQARALRYPLFTF